MTTTKERQDTLRPCVNLIENGRVATFTVILPDETSPETRYARMAQSYLELSGHWTDYISEEIDMPRKFQDALRAIKLREIFDASHPFMIALNKAIAERDMIDEMMHGYNHLRQAMEVIERIDAESKDSNSSNVIEFDQSKGEE